MKEEVFDPAVLADPQVFAIHRLAPHSSHRYRFGDGRACERSLNGTWQFRWAATPEGPFGEPTQITVPGHIQLQGGAAYQFGMPQYVNTQYPWDGVLPLRPGELPQDYAPVGEYRRVFTMPEDWQNCFIRLEGADSAVALWCNGSFIGYSESSFNEAEFDLTAAVQPGENELVARVYRFSSGSWLEDQDFWRMSGLFRPVFLFTKPALHLEDVRLEAVLSQQYTAADLTLTCRLSGALQGSIRLELGGACAEQPLAETVTLKIHLDAPRLWSAEQPNLYTAVLTLCDAEGVVEERADFKVGVREFCLRDGLLCLNGERIVFKGVNRHPWSATLGRAVTRAETEWDLRNMKRHNINAVRTSHYPDQRFFYELCDELGLYVIDETNLETHGTWGLADRDAARILPGDKPEWRDAVLARAAAMLERDKNHPCVLLWSCGNESFGGSTLQAMHDYFRAADPSRLVHYEGIFNDRSYPDTSDVESQMYTPAAEVEAFLEAHPEKPFIMCEYGHAMGNSCGALERYTELSKRQPRYQGGFLWEYMDHALYKELPGGGRVLVYGGDFGDRPTDYEFCVDGLVTATRENTPKMQAVKAVYQDFDLTMDEQKLTITNRTLFTDLAEYELRFTLARDGEPQAERTLQRALAPGQGMELPLPLAIPAEPGCYTLDAAVVRRTATAWAAAGESLAAGQLVVERASCCESRPAVADAVRLVTGGLHIGAVGAGFHYLFNRNSGRLVSLRAAGAELLESPVELSFWRAPTNNDLGAAQPHRFAEWALAGRYAALTEMTTEQGESEVRIHTGYKLATPAEHRVEADWRITGDGRCTVTLRWLGEAAELPEFGLLLPLDKKYQTVSYFGRGPEENMPDRTAGSLFGRWQYAVEDGASLNLWPQEYGARTGVRSAELTGQQMPPLRLGCGTGMVFSALPWTPQELENARHSWELPPISRTVVRCSLGQRGAAGDNSWGALPHEEYRFAVQTGDVFAMTLDVMGK